MKKKRTPRTRILKIELCTETGLFLRFVNLKQVTKGVSHIMVADWFTDIWHNAENIQSEYAVKAWKPLLPKAAESP